MAQAGANVRLYVGGTPVPFSPVPMELVSGKIYKLTNADADKTIWKEPDEFPTYAYMETKDYSYSDLPFEKFKDLVPYLFVYDGGVTSSDRVDPDNILYVDWLNGRITFKDSYTIIGTIYVSTEYIPFSKLVCVKTLNITETAELANVTTWKTVEDTGDSIVRSVQLVNREGSMNGYYEPTNGFEDILRASGYLILRVYPDIQNQPNTLITAKVLLESNDKGFDIDNPNSEDTSFKIEMYSEVIE